VQVSDEGKEHRKYRQLKKKFDKIALDHHISLHHRIQSLIKRPFENPPTLPYISKTAGSIHHDSKFLLTRSLSLPDLLKFEKSDERLKEFKQWYLDNYGPKEFNSQGVIEEIEVDLLTNPVFKHCRANSTNVIGEMINPVVVRSFDEQNHLYGNLENDDDDKSEASVCLSTYSDCDEKVYYC
jgi:hypothetical protein